MCKRTAYPVQSQEISDKRPLGHATFCKRLSCPESLSIGRSVAESADGSPRWWCWSWNVLLISVWLHHTLWTRWDTPGRYRDLCPRSLEKYSTSGRLDSSDDFWEWRDEQYSSIHYHRLSTWHRLNVILRIWTFAKTWDRKITSKFKEKRTWRTISVFRYVLTDTEDMKIKERKTCFFSHLPHILVTSLSRHHLSRFLLFDRFDVVRCATRDCVLSQYPLPSDSSTVVSEVVDSMIACSLSVRSDVAGPMIADSMIADAKNADSARTDCVNVTKQDEDEKLSRGRPARSIRTWIVHETIRRLLRQRLQTCAGMISFAASV